MLNEETPAAPHPMVGRGRVDEVDRIKVALLVAAALASVLVALVAARSFVLVPY